MLKTLQPTKTNLKPLTCGVVCHLVYRGRDFLVLFFELASAGAHSVF